MRSTTLALCLSLVALVTLSACATGRPVRPAGATRTGQTACSSCKGTGTCPHCANDQRECTACAGNGQIQSGDKERTCSVCDGTGRRTCYHCEGTLNCPWCQGSGYRD